MKIGVIGGGQLAQMLALAAYPLGLKVICLEPNAKCPAGLVTDVIVGDYHDEEKLRELAAATDAITYEFENIPANALNFSPNVYPSIQALTTSQDRFKEKSFFQRLQIPTTSYATIDSLDELQQATQKIGSPSILKTRYLGYDGKGQCSINKEDDLQPAWETLAPQPSLLENKIVFDREVSCIGVRSLHGDIAFYPLIENVHKNGILRVSQPIEDESEITRLAQKYVGQILQEFEYVGVLTVEFFEKDGQLIANEFAPRVHNSGHWTIEGAYTSQFENHLRAICGLPLGSTAVRSRAVMVNLIGEIPPLTDLLALPQTYCHLYGKAARPGRKLGHVTLCVDKNDPSFAKKKQQLCTIPSPD